MKGRYWDRMNNRPEPQLEQFLEEKAQSVRKRIKEGTGVDTKPIYYSAGFKEEGIAQERPYNLSKLLYYIIKFTPKEKRLSYVDHINRDESAWKDNDGDYQQGIMESLGETISDCAMEGASIGSGIGGIFGETGAAIGGAIGGVVGGVVGAAKGVWDAVTSGCYITTAVCEEYGKPDDCYELTAFRGFRDNWLVQQPDGEALIKQYYDTAPAIVEQINKQPHRAEIYRHLKEHYLDKCLTHIENGENAACKKLYITMMNYLQGEKDKWLR